MTFTSDELLEIVKASPACVAKHDKEGWLRLFARDAVVEDPVGSAPNRRGVMGGKSQDEVGRFYDTFIGPNEIRFEVKEDIVSGAHVLRDVVIHTRLSNGFEIAVPAHLLYEMKEEDGEVRIARLAAHWELPRLSVQAMRGGVNGMRTLVEMGARMLRVQGVSGAVGYTRFMRGVFGRGRRAVEGVAEAIRKGDADALAGLFVDGEARIELPYGELCTAAEAVGKVGSGAEVVVRDTTAAGYFATAVVDIRSLRYRSHSLALFAFDSASKKIASARFYVGSTPGSEITPGPS
ncbi:MAG: nuclear transport factor 2 family protein [Deltaproteobacteria bacterium]|nr:nuclear transport factor 2 family protein [Deltaproteobacteria bacterium]